MKNVIFAVSDLFSLALARNDSIVARKLVWCVSEVYLTGCGHMLVDELYI